MQDQVTFEVKERFVDAAPDLVTRLQKEFLSESYAMSNPMAKPIYTGVHQESTRWSRYGWFWWAEMEEQRWILGMDVGPEPIGRLRDRGFIRWLAHFGPRDCNDWLLAPRLYAQILCFGEPDWNGIASRQGGNEAEILSTTRGLLAWETQYRLLIWKAKEDISREAIDRLIADYRKRKPEALSALESIRLGKRSLRAIFDDHPEYFLGTPDYYASGLLSRYLLPK